MKTSPGFTRGQTCPSWLALGAVVLLATPTWAATATIDRSALPAMAAQPLFHAAPLLLAEPDNTDTVHSDGSRFRSPRTNHIPTEFGGLHTRNLTPQMLDTARRQFAAHMRPSAATTGSDTLAPMATGSTVTTYTPAQIRAAYGLPALPVTGGSLTADQAAQMGAGQTIYIVDAYHDPNAAAELATFNQRFGLPACTTRTIPVNAALPLAAPSSSGCELAVVYNTANGAMTATAPAYDSGWATEITLDVQWAHATAPLARIVLIEAPDASLNSLLGAVMLANAMGPGVVSMSFGATEGSWTASVDSAFTAANMTYLAATGDNGAGVSWPSVSANVVAVGGTTLTYTGASTRYEVSWSGTGGGISAYTPTPRYQTSAVPGMGTLARRALAPAPCPAWVRRPAALSRMSPSTPTPPPANTWRPSPPGVPRPAGSASVAPACRPRSGRASLP
jgi:hypothetical protein